MNMQTKVVIVYIVLLVVFTGTAYANVHYKEGDFTSEKPMTVKEVYKAKGYTTEVKKTIKQFEEKYQSKLYLPEREPFEVSETYGKIKEDNTLSLHFLGVNKKDLFQIEVNPNKPFRKQSNYITNNGKKVFIEEVNHEPIIRILYMKNAKFEYILSINNSEKYEQQLLIKIAESISE
ncbi:hypothetical protein [Oceanobacillus kapialis]|uniref:DUF4367 domain-containing protein n=1 Tax=Oceanobacillus kapialis TaxID=481353 RepID=A0ABW5PZD0_9BACI